MNTGSAIGINIALAILLMFSAYFSATETAFTSFSQARMKSLALKKKSQKLALKLGLISMEDIFGGTCRRNRRQV